MPSNHLSFSLSLVLLVIDKCLCSHLLCVDIEAQGIIFADVVDGSPTKVPYPVGPLGRCTQRPAASDVMDCCGLTRPAATDVMGCCGFTRQGEVAFLEELLCFPTMVPYPISPQGRCVSLDRCANMPAATDEARHQKHQQKRKFVIKSVKSSFAIYKFSRLSWTSLRSWQIYRNRRHQTHVVTLATRSGIWSSQCGKHP